MSSAETPLRLFVRQRKNTTAIWLHGPTSRKWKLWLRQVLRKIAGVIGKGNRMRRSVNKFDVEKARNEWAAIHRARSLVKCLEDEVLSKDPILLVRLIQEISYHCKIGWAYLSQCLGQPVAGAEFSYARQRDRLPYWRWPFAGFSTW